MSETTEIDEIKLEPLLPKPEPIESSEQSNFFIFLEALTGGLSMLLVVIYMSTCSGFAGNLPNSGLYVEAIGIADVYQQLPSYIFWGLNSGLNVLAGRYAGDKNYSKIHQILKKYMLCIFLVITITFFYNIAIYAFLGNLYKTKPDLKDCTRFALVFTFFEFGAAYYCDAFRQLFQSREFYYLSFWIQFVGMIFTFGCSYIMIEDLHLDFLGVNLGPVTSQLLNLMIYLAAWVYFPQWKDYWESIKSYQLKKKKRRERKKREKQKINPVIVSIIDSKNTTEMNSNISILDNNINEEIKPRRKSTGVSSNTEEKVVKIDNLSGFLKFNFMYASSYFLDGFWTLLDTLLATYFFDDSVVSAQASFIFVIWTQVVEFSYGYTNVLCTKISQMMMQGDWRKAKKLTITYSLQILALTSFLSFLLYYFEEKLCHLVMKDPVTLAILRQFTRFYTIVLPFDFLAELTFSVCRSINKQTQFFYSQIFCNYILHFFILFLLIKYTEIGGISIWISYFICRVVLTIIGYSFIFSSDWEKEAYYIQEQMEEEEGKMSIE